MAVNCLHVLTAVLAADNYYPEILSLKLKQSFFLFVFLSQDHLVCPLICHLRLYLEWLSVCLSVSLGCSPVLTAV